MSPLHPSTVTRSSGVPRASGDEPRDDIYELVDAACSPRERG